MNILPQWDKLQPQSVHLNTIQKKLGKCQSKSNFNDAQAENFNVLQQSWVNTNPLSAWFLTHTCLFLYGQFTANKASDRLQNPAIIVLCVLKPKLMRFLFLLESRNSSDQFLLDDKTPTTTREFYWEHGPQTTTWSVYTDDVMTTTAHNELDTLGYTEHNISLSSTRRITSN